MSGSAATAARHKLEHETLGAVYDLILGDQPKSSTAPVPAEDEESGRKRKRMPSGAPGPKRQKLEGSAGNDAAVRTRLERALSNYVARLPVNHGAQLCLEELFSFLRHLHRDRDRAPTKAAVAPRSTNGIPDEKLVARERPDEKLQMAADAKATADGKARAEPPTAEADSKPPTAGCLNEKATRAEGLSVDAIMEATIRFLECPPFGAFLAAFGRLPGHPYLLVFDPHSYQNASPAAIAAAAALREQLHVGPSTSLTLPIPEIPTSISGAGSEAIQPHGHMADLEKQGEMLVLIFNEDHKPTGMRCPACKEARYLNIWTVQARSADEGSGYIIHCLRCNDLSHIR